MSFPVAVQSAVFYIVACTPCAKVRHRHKAKETARKERQGKARLETEQPGLYRHPSPFATNPYWQEEITMGPALPKKTTSKNSSQRGLSSSGRDSDAPSTVSESTHVAGTDTNPTDSTTVIPETDGLSEDWNRRKGYQREDEELWGQWSGHKLMDAFSKARDSAGRLIDNKLGRDREVTEQDRRDFYFAPKNPPVNDYHPPVVSSKAPQKDAHRWMLQPPPPAKVMEGKVPVTRAVSTASRSSSRTTPVFDGGANGYANASGTSSASTAAARGAKKESDMTEQELIEFLFATRSNRSTSFTRTRSLSLDGVDESAELAYDRERRSKMRRHQHPRRAAVTDDSGSDSDDYGYDTEEEKEQLGVSRMPMAQPPKQSARARPSAPAATRPKLETIASSNAGVKA